MKQSTIVRISIGLAAVAAGFVVMVAASGAAATQSQRILTACAVMGLIFGGVAASIAGWREGIWGALIGVAVAAITTVENDTWARRMAFALGALGILYAGFRQFYPKRRGKKRRKNAARFRLPPKPRTRAGAYRMISILLSMAGGLCAIAWLFLDVPYRLFESICILLPVAAFGLYLFYYDDLARFKKTEREARTLFPWIVPVLGLFARMILDFNFDAPAQFLLPVAVTVIVGMAMFFIVLGRKKPPVRTVLAMLVSVIFFAVGAAGHVNYLLDGGARTVEHTGTVSEMRISSGARQFTRYIVTVELAEGKRNLSVSQSLYESLAAGNDVTVRTRTGALGISYSDILPTAEEAP